VADQSNWSKPYFVPANISAAAGLDKEQVWADNAASSPHFGNVYLCFASFRSNSQGNASPQPLKVAVSSDGGGSWTEHQVTQAETNPFNPRHGFGRSGCTVRTASDGTVYAFADQFATGTPGIEAHLMVKSFDGGKTWTRPVKLFNATNTCFLVQTDGTGFRCTEVGVAGARQDLSAAPSVSIANGAPSGQGATDEIVDTWVDGRDGPSVVHVMTSYSTDGGGSWSDPKSVETPGDRGYYAAPALSPDGKDLYLVYNAFTTPLREDTTSPRGLVGVVMHSDIGAGGAPGAFHTLHRGQEGDPRASAQNNAVLEFLGDYVYAAATDSYAVAVWNDVRDAADCPAVDAWRATFQAGSPTAHPEPQQDCPATFGNTDIFGGSFTDPTP
jgi:hypothetical protein